MNVEWSDGTLLTVNAPAWTAMCETLRVIVEDCQDIITTHSPIPLPHIDPETGKRLDAYVNLCHRMLGNEAGKTGTVPLKKEQMWPRASSASFQKLSPGGANGQENQPEKDDPVRPVFKFEMEFLKPFTLEQINDLREAADFVHCSWLLDATAQHTAGLADQTVKEVVEKLPAKASSTTTGLSDQDPLDVMRAQVIALRKKLNIESDFTPEEEEAALRENEWIYDFSQV